GSGLAAGTYTVTLLATNATDGVSATTTFSVTVGNETPTVSTVVVSPSGTITAGSTAVSVSGAWSDPGNGLSPPESYSGTVAWGHAPSDSIPVNSNGPYPTPTHVYADGGSSPITVSIGDNNALGQDPSCPAGTSASTTATVTEPGPTISSND